MTAITNSTSTPNPNSLLLRPLPVSLPRVEFWRVGTAPAPREVGERLLVEQFGYNGREAGAGGAADVDSEPANGEGAPSVPVVEGPYRRFIPPDAEQLHKHVEYDCDPADALWMDHFNDQRAKTKPPVAPVPYDYFEVVMDSIEKEWFALQAKIPRPDDWAPVEDSQCAVCGDGECENSNAIVFCDGCNLAVHQGRTILLRRAAISHTLTVGFFRLLWRPVYPRRAMAMSEMHSLSRQARVLRPMSKRIWRIQADDQRQMGTSPVCYMGQRDGRQQYSLHGTG